MIHRYHIEARVFSDTLPMGRISCLRSSDDAPVTGKCSVCGKEIKYWPPKWEEIETVACMGECANKAGFYPKRIWVSPEKKNKPKSKTAVDSASQPVKPNAKEIKPVKPPCEKCGGPPAGMGWKHRKVYGKPCPLSTEAKLQSKSNEKTTLPVCPKCGGTKRGKGWSHVEIDGKPCPLSTEAKLKANKKKDELFNCPKCGGGKRGRGWAHQLVNGEMCSLAMGQK